jgi:hypothetical protein
MTVFFDVDGTLIDDQDRPRYEVIDLLRAMVACGQNVFVWSGGGFRPVQLRDPMTEVRIRCSGKGKRHSMHIYHRDNPEKECAYLNSQPWTEFGCRPFVLERREVGPWLLVGQELEEK